MEIRKETQQDYKEIYSFVKTAFETAKVSDGDEQDFVERLRAGKCYISELALVATDNNRIVGHIMLTKLSINKIDGGVFNALLLAPLAVELSYRNKGLGAELINKSFELAKELGYTAVFLCGDPAYYSRFGFKTSADFGITNTNGIPDMYSQACELVPNALDGIEGTFDFMQSDNMT